MKKNIMSTVDTHGNLTATGEAGCLLTFGNATWLVYTGIEDKQLRVLNTKTGSLKIIPTRKKVASINPTNHQAMVLLGMEDSFFTLDLISEDWKLVNNLRLKDPMLRINETRIDPEGNIVFTVMHQEKNKTQNAPGFLARLPYDCSTDTRYEVLIENQAIPNGMAWTENGHFYYIESRFASLSWYGDYNGSKKLGSRTVAAYISDGWSRDESVATDCYGDGMELAYLNDRTVLVIGMQGKGAIHIYDLEKGDLLVEVIAPETNSLTCPCLLYTSPSPRDQRGSRMPSSA